MDTELEQYRRWELVRLKVQTNLLNAMVDAAHTFKIDWRYLKITEEKLRGHFMENYEGDYDLPSVIQMSCNPRTRGFARELRLIFKDIAKKINDARDNGYTEDAIETILTLMQ